MVENDPSGDDRIIFNEGLVNSAGLESLQMGVFVARSMHQQIGVDTLYAS